VPEIVNMEPPYLLLQGIGRLLEGYFDSFNPVEVRPAGLGITTCCFDGDPKRLLIGLMNNDLFADWKGTFRVRVGKESSVAEIWRGQAITVDEPIALQVPAGGARILDVRLK